MKKIVRGEVEGTRSDLNAFQVWNNVVKAKTDVTLGDIEEWVYEFLEETESGCKVKAIIRK